MSHFPQKHIWRQRYQYIQLMRDARPGSTSRGVAKGKAANKGCVIEQVTTVGDWDQIFLGSLPDQRLLEEFILKLEPGNQNLLTAKHLMMEDNPK